MAAALLLLDVETDPQVLLRLAASVGELIQGSREIGVVLRDESPEEILATCASLGLRVRRSRVVGYRNPCDQVG
jgi:hypothetical protein